MKRYIVVSILNTISLVRGIIICICSSAKEKALILEINSLAVTDTC